jgi:hypothetical protein
VQDIYQAGDAERLNNDLLKLGKIIVMKNAGIKIELLRAERPQNLALANQYLNKMDYWRNEFAELVKRAERESKSVINEFDFAYPAEHPVKVVMEKIRDMDGSRRRSGDMLPTPSLTKKMSSSAIMLTGA